VIKAVLFDMNGVIIDDLLIHAIAFNEVLLPYGIGISHKDYLNDYAGRTDRDGFEDMEKKFALKLPIGDLLVRKGRAYVNLFPEHKKSFPGVVDLVKKLSTIFVLALTSSASKSEIELTINEFKIDSYFKVIVSADDVKHGKPNPEPYQKTISLLGFKPDECVVIEDAKDGIMSAKAAGSFCIAITTTHNRDVLTKADIVVDSFYEIFEAIGKINKDLT